MKVDTAQFGKVAVLMGGLSAEREISLQSGNAVLTALQNKGVDAHAVDVGENIINELDKGNFQRALSFYMGVAVKMAPCRVCLK